MKLLFSHRAQSDLCWVGSVWFDYHSVMRCFLTSPSRSGLDLPTVQFRLGNSSLVNTNNLRWKDKDIIFGSLPTGVFHRGEEVARLGGVGCPQARIEWFFHQVERVWQTMDFIQLWFVPYVALLPCVLIRSRFRLAYLNFVRWIIAQMIDVRYRWHCV